MRRTVHPDDYSMSFGDHLEELRRRILWGLAVPVPLMVITFLLGEPLIQWLYQPLDRVLAADALPRRLQVLGPAEMLMVQLKLSLIAAVVLSAPWILWQAWLFVRPGLYGHERRFVYFLLPGSALLTVAGVVLMYYVMLPVTLRVLVSFGNDVQLQAPQTAIDPRASAVLDGSPVIELKLKQPADPRPGQVWLLVPQQELYVAVEGSPIEIIRVPPSGGPIIDQVFRLTTYINFVLMLMLGIAIAFQMPLAILLLGWVGLLSAATLRAKRRYAIFICAVIAAVVTPGADPWSMLMMLAPLLALFELSIVLLTFVPASAVAEGNALRRFMPRRRKLPAGPVVEGDPE
jgi:sec-independent protein translocase protein TatC